MQEAGMTPNAYIVHWTMENWRRLQDELTQAGFETEIEPESENLRAAVPFERLAEFAALCQAHFKDPVAYVDVQFPDRKKTALIFGERLFLVSSAAENAAVQRWAIGQGLKPEHTGWAISFDSESP
jgi:hypothetical protein